MIERKGSDVMLLPVKYLYQQQRHNCIVSTTSDLSSSGEMKFYSIYDLANEFFDRFILFLCYRSGFMVGEEV